MSPTVDIVTLDNLATKTTKWDPESPTGHRYAVIDMGSNGIRFSISDLSPPRARLLKCIYRERAAISLFDALHSTSREADADPEPDDLDPAPRGTVADDSDASGSDIPAGLDDQQPLHLPPQTITLVAATLARFRRIAVESYAVPPQHVTVFATEAMRRAANAGSMLDAIRAAAPDLTVQILAPEVETLFGSVGARSAFGDVKGLFLDLGGGSVQMTYMDTFAARSSDGDELQDGYEVTAAQTGQSLPYGAARFIRILEGEEAHVQVNEKSKLQDGLRSAFADLRGRFPTLASSCAPPGGNDNDNGIDLYLCGGGFRGYGSMLMHTDPIQPYPIPAIGTYTVSGERFRETRRMLESNRTYSGRIFGMSKRRRAQFPAIVAVVEALIAALAPARIRSATFCAGGNREGALMMKLPRDVRESNPMSLLASQLPPGMPSPAGTSARQDDQVADTIRTISKTLRSALPTTISTTDLLSKLGLDGLFIPLIWHRTGERPDANAAAALHDAVTRDSSCPGLTHLARAVLAIALCARWEGRLGPADQQLHESLRALIARADTGAVAGPGSDAVFWAEYMGAAAAVVARAVPAWPGNGGVVERAVRFEARAERGAKKLKIRLDVFVGDGALPGTEADKMAAVFKGLGRDEGGKKKVTVLVHPMVRGE